MSMGSFEPMPSVIVSMTQSCLQRHCFTATGSSATSRAVISRVLGDAAFSVTDGKMASVAQELLTAFKPNP
jgi:hypothetical protein